MGREATSFILIVIAYIIIVKCLYIDFVNIFIMGVSNEKRCNIIINYHQWLRDVLGLGLYYIYVRSYLNIPVLSIHVMTSHQVTPK
jgi:hypothetical protein